MKLPESVDGMAHDPPKHIVEVFPRVDVKVLAGLNEAHVKGNCAAVPFAIVFE
jgi:hypothetical protein